MSTVVPLQSFAILRQSLLWLSILVASTAAQMPYNPTRILRNGSLVYVFQPSAGSSQFELGIVDISSKVAATRLPYTTLYPTLPFLNSKETRPFNAILDASGNITVYAGDCALGANGGNIWKFVPELSAKSGNGSWQQQDTTFAQDGKHLADIGPNYLSAGVAFSTEVHGDALSTDAYFFGGMCPFPDANGTDWQSAANYSNYMVTLEPSQASANSVDYQLGVSSSRGPPIAEAGFSLTGLNPSISNRSDGVQIQQQNFVLIAGHTGAAFINTSQVALFSLPQQGWTFVPVAQPVTSRTDLAIRTEGTLVEPRSGHSAVLTPDGQHVVIFGGWIGDINTPADPQLAVLNVGDGYGGSGAWQWTVPTTSGSALPTRSGIYGHGAAMLPGGVMMIMGGYSIAATSSRLRRASNANSQTFFYNVTSNAWMSDYSAPADPSSQPAKGGILSTPAQKAGLGAGLGIGCAALLGLIGFYIWYTRKLKRQRDAREKHLNDLSMGAHRLSIGAMLPGMSSRGAQDDYLDHSNDSYFYPAVDQHNQGWRRADTLDAERTGLLVEIPSPTRGLRRSLGGRPNQQISRYDERRVRGSGHIHPIDELDEEQEQEAVNDRTPLAGQQMMMECAAHQGASIFDNAPVLDPFTDGHRPGEDRRITFHSAPSSPTREFPDPNRNVTNSRVVAALNFARQPNPGSDGRLSPTKSSERTGSNLSERSTMSISSSRSAHVSLGHSASMRSAAMLNSTTHANPFKTPDDSPTADTANQSGSGWQTSVDLRTRSLTSIRSNGRPNTANADADSFTTARSSFMALQVEGEALLGGNPERARPTTSSTSEGSYGHSDNTEDSMSRAGAVTAATSLTEGLARAAFGRERRKSWLGSMRRALSRTTTPADRTRSLTTATMHFESYKDDPNTVQDTPSAHNRWSLPASAPPRRAASDASFWRSRRGKQDWLEDELDPNDPRAKWRRTSGDDWGTPEDFALAEKERRRREWRDRGNLLINLTDDHHLPTPRTPIIPGELGSPFANNDRPTTPADEDDWDVEAAVERRVVQVMFTVPRSKLRVVNADVDRSSILSLPREHSDDGTESNGTPSRVKDLAGKFEQMSSPRAAPRASPRASPRPSPSSSIRSMKIRPKKSSASLSTPRKSSAHSTASKGKTRIVDE